MLHGIFLIQADETVKKEVNGLEGNPDIHDSYIDIEPVSNNATISLLCAKKMDFFIR